jgi:hypothetical protein
VHDKLTPTGTHTAPVVVVDTSPSDASIAVCMRVCWLLDSITRYILWVGQDRVYTPYYAVYLDISLLKLLYIHRIYTVYICIRSWPTVLVMNMLHRCLQRRVNSFSAVTITATQDEVHMGFEWTAHTRHCLSQQNVSWTHYSLSALQPIRRYF